MLKDAIARGYWNRTMDARGLYLCGTAYMVTRDKSYLERAINHLAVFRDTLYEKSDSYLDGNSQPNHMDWQYFQQRFGIFLAGLAKEEMSINYKPEYFPLCTSTQVQSITFTLHLRGRKDRDHVIRLAGSGRGAVLVHVHTAGDKAIFSGQLAPRKRRFERIINVPRDGEITELSITLRSKAPITLEPPVGQGMLEVYEFPYVYPYFRSRFVMNRNPSLYFYVPSDCERVVVSAEGQHPASMKLFTPSGTILARKDVNPRKRSLEYRFLRAERGKTCRLLPMANFVNMVEGPKYFAFSPQDLFTPRAE